MVHAIRLGADYSNLRRFAIRKARLTRVFAWKYSRQLVDVCFRAAL